MARAIASIPHVSWRDGRPRFQPSKTLREQGFRGKDLRHENGDWFTRGQAVDWSDSFSVQIKAERAANPTAWKNQAPRKAPQLFSMRKMFHLFFQAPAHQGKTITIGKRIDKGLSKNTIMDYKQKARVLEAHDPLLYDAAIEALTRRILIGLFEELWEQRGLATARGSLAVLSAAITWAINRDLLPEDFQNPALRLRLQQPAPRVRVAEPFEIEALINAADALGRPEIGDMISLAIFSGQRQGDRLTIEHKREKDGRFVFKQSKTQAIVDIPQAPRLIERFNAATVRRVKAGIIHNRAVLNESTWKPFAAATYRHIYNEVRALAVHGSVNFGLKPCPQLADFREGDLRDTAITFLARAGNDIPHICAVSGHSLQSATQVLKHYLALHPEMADTAITKLVEWYDLQNGTA